MRAPGLASGWPAGQSPVLPGPFPMTIRRSAPSGKSTPRQGGKAARPGPDLWALVAPLSAAASIGSLAAILGSFRQLNPVVVQRVDTLTLLAGLAGAVTGWFLGRGLARLGRDGSGTGTEAKRLRRRVVAGLLVLGVAVLAAFVLAVVGLPDSRRGDMIEGALLAVLVLSAGGFGLRQLSRIFGRPDEP